MNQLAKYLIDAIWFKSHCLDTDIHTLDRLLHQCH